MTQNSQPADAAPRIVTLTPRPIEAMAFAPFGDLIAPAAYGAPYGPGDAGLDLAQGTPRAYIMRAPDHGLTFHRITRHDRVTQCLSAALGGTWYLVVAAPPADPARAVPPSPDELHAFEISGAAMVKLHAGTWHAGPYFQAPHMDFVNIELADTNKVDHNVVDLRATWGVEIALAPETAAGENA